MTGGVRSADAPLWSPSLERAAATNLARFVTQARAAGYDPPPASGVVDYASLHAWSVAYPARFWATVWRFCGVVAQQRPDGSFWSEVVHGIDRMAPPDAELGPRWFLGARFNFAENLLRFRDDHPALIVRNE
ncbi:MAG TPA: acetoacetate--CoA ligase, partial [Gemmatimonadaceae bacterium]|nr:acetoacetate--CoA ligase [Gemmatimonadaceae bacterium]